MKWTEHVKVKTKLKEEAALDRSWNEWMRRNDYTEQNMILWSTYIEKVAIS